MKRGKIWVIVVLWAVIWLPPAFAKGREKGAREHNPNCFAWSEKKGTQLDQILKWEDLSDQYVLGYGAAPPCPEDGTDGSRVPPLDNCPKTLVPYAVYDKTFHDPSYSHFWYTLLLGSIGIGNVSLADLPQVQAGNTDLPPENQPLSPFLIIDLKYKERSYAKAAEWAGLTSIAISGLRLIPVIYGPPQAIGAQLEKTFDLIKMLLLARHGQALELVAEALDGNTHSPFYTDKLSRHDLEDAVFYLVRSRVKISAIIENFFKQNSALSEKYIYRMNQLRESSLENIRSRGISFYPFEHSYFGLGIKRDPKDPCRIVGMKIYCLAHQKAFGKKPMAVVDLLHPKKEVIRRGALQVFLYSSNFIYVPIPFVPTALKILWKELFIKGIQRRQVWESGLLAHIHHNPYELRDFLMKEPGMTLEEAEETEKLAITILEETKINPLDLDTGRGRVNQKRVEAWLKGKDPSYVPITDSAIVLTAIPEAESSAFYYGCSLPQSSP